MDNKLIFENYLLILKSTVEVYVHGTLESANNDVREILNNNLNDTLNMQAKTYELMSNNNWYQVKNINPKIINESLNKEENN